MGAVLAGLRAAPKPRVHIDRYCISPQLAPSTLTPEAKKLYAEAENYHAGRAVKDSGRK